MTFASAPPAMETTNGIYSRKILKMSSPSRLLRGRPTAPLPTQYASNSVNSLHKSELQAEETTRSPSFSGHYKINSAHRPSRCTSVDVDFLSSEETIKNFLRSHKSFLEEFILEDVPQETLERILVRKAQRKNSASGITPSIFPDFKRENHDCGTPKALSRKYCVCADKQDLLGNLTRSIHNGVPLSSVLLQLTKSVEDAVKANISELFLVESDALVPVLNDTDPKGGVLSVNICVGGTVEGFVATTKQCVNVNVHEERNNTEFPEGTRLARKAAVASVVCIPILRGDGSILGILTLGRNASEPQFSVEDEEIAKIYLTLATDVISLAKEHGSCVQQQKLINTYKQITKLMLESDCDFNAVLQHIDDAITNLVNADRSALFLVDSEGKQLYAQIFSVSKQEEEVVTLEHFEQMCFGEYLDLHGCKTDEVVCYKGHNITFSIDKGVAGYTARTGETQNITDVKSCSDFCAEVDELTGYSTKTLLCAPIIAAGKVLGVLEAVNKKSGCAFSETDEECLKSLAEFVGLITIKCRTKENLITAENKLKVAQEILAYHRPCSDDHFRRVKELSLSPEHQCVVQNMSVNTSVLSLDVKAQLVVTMFKDLVDITRFEFDQDCLLRFTLTAAKNYRGEEYHNWDHAFSVAHCMYWIIKGAPERFSDLERISLFWGCLCHDLDHRGHNNTFLVKTGAPLAKLYSSSVLENHHFSQALSLLQLEDHDIFSCLSSEQYKKVLTIMQKAILATDLVLFFGNKDKFSKIVRSGEFSWDVPGHKELVLSLMMTNCDLCSSCKVWEDHRHSVDALFKEFHIQGDKEKALGMKPLEMMDRDYKHKLPSCQVGFLRSITCPCCELLVTALPHVNNLLRNAQNNMKMWEKISEETTTD